jgi:peptidoglycan/LPS O-acetylase OafA/YrhL
MCLTLFAFIAYRTADPTSYVTPMGLTALGISALLCGWLCTKLWGHHSLIPALVGGVIFAALIGAAGLCIPGSTLTAAVRCAGCPSMAVLSLIGGLLGQRRTRRRRRRT